MNSVHEEMLSSLEQEKRDVEVTLKELIESVDKFEEVRAAMNRASSDQGKLSVEAIMRAPSILLETLRMQSVDRIAELGHEIEKLKSDMEGK